MLRNAIFCLVLSWWAVCGAVMVGCVWCSHGGLCLVLSWWLHVHLAIGIIALVSMHVLRKSSQTLEANGLIYSNGTDNSPTKTIKLTRECIGHCKNHKTWPLVTRCAQLSGSKPPVFWNERWRGQQWHQRQQNFMTTYWPHPLICLLVMLDSEPAAPPKVKSRAVAPYIRLPSMFLVWITNTQPSLMPTTVRQMKSQTTWWDIVARKGTLICTGTTQRWRKL